MSNPNDAKSFNPATAPPTKPAPALAPTPAATKDVAAENAANKVNAKNPEVKSQEKVVTTVGVESAKERLATHLTVLKTVHESLKATLNELGALAAEKGNSTINQKLELAAAQLESVERNVLNQS